MRRLLPALLVAAVLPYVVNLGASSIWDANEAYYVETPREMIERGDYINPSFNYEPRFNKPVLSYWIVAGLYKAFGVSVGAQRVAIAAAAMVMLVGTYFIARAASAPASAQGFGGAGYPLAPLLATLGLAAGPRFFMFSRRILVDMAIAAMMTLILLFFALAERYPARRRLFLLLMYVCVGLGVLTKGPVAAVVPALVFLVYLAVHRELSRLRHMMIPAGIVIALAIVAPWYVALYDQHGWTYIEEFFITENLGRYTETVGVQTRGPFFYLPVVLHDSLPWSFFLPAAVFGWWQSRRSSAQRSEGGLPQLRIHTLLVLWIAVSVIFFSFSRTKQDLYIFHIVAAVAVLGGDFVARAFDRLDTRLAGRSLGEGGWVAGTLAALALVLVMLGALVLYFFVGVDVYRIDGAGLAGGVTLAGGLVIAALLLRRSLPAAVAATLAVCVAFNWILVLRVLPGFEQYKPVVPLSSRIQLEASPQDAVAHFDVALPSMVFYLRRHIDIWIDVEAFANQIRSQRKVLAVLPADRYAQLAREFGVPTCELARHPTSDIRLRTLLGREPPSEVVLISNRCVR